MNNLLDKIVFTSLLSVTVFRFAPRAENILWDEPRPWSSIYGFSSNMNREVVNDSIMRHV